MPTKVEQPVYTWGIATLERDASDGYVHTAHWTVSATLGDHSASAYGSVGLERPDGDLIPYEELTKSQVLGWVKGKLGEGTVQATEASLASEIAKQQAPKTVSGLPW